MIHPTRELVFFLTNAVFEILRQIEIIKDTLLQKIVTKSCVFHTPTLRYHELTKRLKDGQSIG